MYKKIIIIVLLVILVPTIYIGILLNSNKRHDKIIYNSIKSNTDIKSVSYVNFENNYYVVKDNDNVYVLDNKYKEIYNVKLNKIKKSNMDLVYKRNNLYYVDKIIRDNDIVYRYYDIYSLKKKFEVVIGG